MSLIEAVCRTAESHPDAVFSSHIATGHDLTYSRFSELTNRLRNHFTRLALPRGSNIAVLTTNHWLFHPLLVGCAAEGHVLVPVNPHLHRNEVTFILEDSSPKLILTEEELLLEKRFDRIPQLTLETLLREIESLPADAPESTSPLSDTALMVYTSGTTGVGKGVMLSEENLVAMATLLSDFYDVRRTDRFLCVLPLHQMNGIMITGILPLVAGAQTVLGDVYSFLNAKFYWDLVAERRITVCSLVPSIMAMMLRLFPDGTKAAVGSVRHGLCGTAPLLADTWEEFEKRFGFPVYQGYGLTETTTWVTCTPHKADHRYDSVGVPLGTEIELEGVGRNPARNGGEGEVLIKGPMVMVGYHKKNKQTREMFKGGFLKSGDIGYFDKDGELHISGRKKEIIIRNGVNINPIEVDEIVAQHNGILECKTVGMSDQIAGEIVATICVAIDSEAPPTSHEIQAWVRDKKSTFYCPDRVMFMGYLPKGPTGKVRVKELNKILSGVLVDDIVKELTRRKFKRAQPHDLERMREIISHSLKTGSSLPFLTYWGCGHRDVINDIDRSALDRLKEFLDGAEYVEEVKCKLTVMLNDVHSTINGVPSEQHRSYYAQIAGYAQSIGMDVIYQSKAWDSSRLDLQRVIDEAKSRDFDETWDSLPIREQLVSQAAKHFRGECNELGARTYINACILEGPAFAESYPDHIFLTYNGPEFNICLPSLPKLYTYSYRKGKTEKPWFQ